MRFDRITVNPNQMGGVPCLRGLRIPGASVVDMVADALRASGFDALHVRERGLQAAEDSVVFAKAMEEDRILVSADTDFGTLLALWRHSRPSVILFRRGAERRPHQQTDLILANLPHLHEALEKGSIVVFDQNRIRLLFSPIS